MRHFISMGGFVVALRQNDLGYLSARRRGVWSRSQCRATQRRVALVP